MVPCVGLIVSENGECVKGDAPRYWAGLLYAGDEHDGPYAKHAGKE